MQHKKKVLFIKYFTPWTKISKIHIYMVIKHAHCSCCKYLCRHITLMNALLTYPMWKSYNLCVIYQRFSWSHTILTSCTIHNLFHHWSSHAEIKSIAMHTWNNKNSHTLTQLFNGKAWSWKPKLSVYNICHRDHVTILIQSWSYQALSTIQSLHTNQARSCKSMHRSLVNELEFTKICSRNPHWHLP